MYKYILNNCILYTNFFINLFFHVYKPACTVPAPTGIINSTRLYGRFRNFPTRYSRGDWLFQNVSYDFFGSIFFFVQLHFNQFKQESPGEERIMTHFIPLSLFSLVRSTHQHTATISLFFNRMIHRHFFLPILKNIPHTRVPWEQQQETGSMGLTLPFPAVQ